MFGCAAYYHLSIKNKLDTKAQKSILVNYENNSKAYRCFNFKTNKIIISSDIHFNEDNVKILPTILQYLQIITSFAYTLIKNQTSHAMMIKNKLQL